MMMQLLFMIQQTMLYKMAFKYGGDTNGILMAASLRVYAFSFIPLWGMSQGAATCGWYKLRSKTV